jgi:hypothetical protein
MTRAVLLIILAVLMVIAGFWLRREWRIDVCSEGGGEWNHSSDVCEPLPN